MEVWFPFSIYTILNCSVALLFSTILCDSEHLVDKIHEVPFLFWQRTKKNTNSCQTQTKLVSNIHIWNFIKFIVIELLNYSLYYCCATSWKMWWIPEKCNFDSVNVEIHNSVSDTAQWLMIRKKTPTAQGCNLLPHTNNKQHICGLKISISSWHFIKHQLVQLEIIVQTPVFCKLKYKI